jgi:hypothetical protein
MIDTGLTLVRPHDNSAKKSGSRSLEAGFLDLRGPVKRKLLPGSVDKDCLAREPR